MTLLSTLLSGARTAAPAWKIGGAESGLIRPEVPAGPYRLQLRSFRICSGSWCSLSRVGDRESSEATVGGSRVPQRLDRGRWIGPGTAHVRLELEGGFLEAMTRVA